MSFKEIKGHNVPISILQSALKQERMSSTYLFLGPDGIGKGLVAKMLAKSANCLNNDAQDSCDACASCLKIDSGNHPDVHWIPPRETALGVSQASDAIKIEYIRQLQESIALRPYEGRFKVFIIDNAHLLTIEASNAFLKTLEEPPAHSLIILISSKPQLLLPTIISRCQKVRFFPLRKDALAQMLRLDYTLDDILGHYLAYSCEGRIGRALSLKGTSALDEKNRIIDYFFSDESASVFREFASKDNIRNALSVLASWLRDVYYLKTGMPHMELMHLDRLDELLGAMPRYSFADLDSLLKLLTDTSLYLEQNINPRLLLSNLRLRLRG